MAVGTACGASPIRGAGEERTGSEAAVQPKAGVPIVPVTPAGPICTVRGVLHQDGRAGCPVIATPIRSA